MRRRGICNEQGESSGGENAPPQSESLHRGYSEEKEDGCALVHGPSSLMQYQREGKSGAGDEGEELAFAAS